MPIVDIFAPIQLWSMYPASSNTKRQQYHLQSPQLSTSHSTRCTILAHIARIAITTILPTNCTTLNQGWIFMQATRRIGIPRIHKPKLQSINPPSFPPHSAPPIMTSMTPIQSSLIPWWTQNNNTIPQSSQFSTIPASMPVSSPLSSSHFSSLYHSLHFLTTFTDLDRRHRSFGRRFSPLQSGYFVSSTGLSFLVGSQHIPKHSPSHQNDNNLKQSLNMNHWRLKHAVNVLSLRVPAPHELDTQPHSQYTQQS